PRAPRACRWCRARLRGSSRSCARAGSSACQASSCRSAAAPARAAGTAPRRGKVWCRSFGSLRGFAARGLALGLVPEGVHFGERRLHRRPALLSETALDVVETVAEPVRRDAQLALRIHAEMSREIDGRKEEVADLAGARGRRVAVHLALDLAQLFTDLGERAARFGPIEA